MNELNELIIILAFELAFLAASFQAMYYQKIGISIFLFLFFILLRIAGKLHFRHLKSGINDALAYSAAMGQRWRVGIIKVVVGLV